MKTAFSKITADWLLADEREEEFTNPSWLKDADNAIQSEIMKWSEVPIPHHVRVDLVEVVHTFSSFTTYYLSNFHKLWTYKMEYALKCEQENSESHKGVDFLVNNELRKKLTDANKLMVAFGTVAHGIREDFNRAVCGANPKVNDPLFWCLAFFAVHLRQYFSDVVAFVQQSVQNSLTELVDEFFWLDYDHEIFMLTVHPAKINLDVISKSQVDVFIFKFKQALQEAKDQIDEMEDDSD